jgi:uncharacterized protein (UPF0333 family)
VSREDPPAEDAEKPAEEPPAEDGAEEEPQGLVAKMMKNKMMLAAAGGGVFLILVIIGSAVGYYFLKKGSNKSTLAAASLDASGKSLLKKGKSAAEAAAASSGSLVEKAKAKGKGKGKTTSAAKKAAGSAATDAADKVSKLGKDDVKAAGNKAAAAGAGIAAMATKAAAQGVDAAQSTAPKGKAKAKTKGKQETNAELKETPKQGHKETEQPAVEEPVEEENLVVDPVVLKAALRIQAYFRGWKARKVVAGVRKWKPNQKVCLFVECINGKEMPSVNTWGGCDPYVEFRLVQGQDPLLQKGGGVTSKAPEGMSFKTESDDGNQNPTWNAKFELKEVPLRKDQFLQVILWDKNTFNDTPIGHQSFMVEKLLEGLTFVAGQDQPKRNSQKISFQSLLEGKDTMRATIQTKFSYVDMVKISFTVVKGSRLPSVKMFGGINSFVELRVDTQDPKKKDFESSPTDSCLWSSKTTPVQDNCDPKFGQNFDVVLPAIACLKLQAIVWDSNAPLPDSPICHSIMDLSGVFGGPIGTEPKEHKLRFTHLPGVSPTGDVRKTIVTVAIGVAPVFDQGVDDD